MPSLVRHPDTPPGSIHGVDAELVRVAGGAVARFRAVGDIARLVIPAPASPIRTAGLWQTSCFEVFVGNGGPGYREYNLSPSGAWAAYRFDDHRQGMREAEAEIEIDLSLNDNNISIVAKIESEFPLPCHVGLTAVIEEADGLIRYWATSFAPGEPDFHAASVRSLLFDGVSAE